MCGIVGASSHRDITPILIEGLKRLEYRGYDSCGVAVHQGGQLRRARSTSRVAELQSQAAEDGIASGTGIAHTRWATHGVPAVRNGQVFGINAAVHGSSRLGVALKSYARLIHPGVLSP